MDSRRAGSTHAGPEPALLAWWLHFLNRPGRGEESQLHRHPDLLVKSPLLSRDELAFLAGVCLPTLNQDREEDCLSLDPVARHICPFACGQLHVCLELHIRETAWPSTPGLLPHLSPRHCRAPSCLRQNTRELSLIPTLSPYPLESVNGSVYPLQNGSRMHWLLIIFQAAVASRRHHLCLAGLLAPSLPSSATLRLTRFSKLGHPLLCSDLPVASHLSQSEKSGPYPGLPALQLS